MREKTYQLCAIETIGRERKRRPHLVVVVFLAAVITVLVVALAIVVECCCDMRCRVRVNKNKDRPELVRNTTSDHISFSCCSDLCLMFLVHQLRFFSFRSFVAFSFLLSFLLVFQFIPCVL